MENKGILSNNAQRCKAFFALCLFAVVLNSCGLSQGIHSSDGTTAVVVPTGEVGNIYTVSDSDAEMNSAIQSAQNTLSLFIQAFQNPLPSQVYFSIKVKIPIEENGGDEHIWVDDLSFANDQFEGTAGNDGVDVDIHAGDHIVVKKEDISDWMIIENERLLGGFTIIVLRNRMTDSEREEFDADLWFAVPDEPEVP